MPLENTRYAFNTYVIHVTIKGSSCQCLVEGICQVILKRYLLNYYITPLNYISHESSVLLSICLYFRLFLSSLDCASLSQNSVMDCTTKGMTPSPMRNFLSQTISFATLEVATYSASIMQSTIQDCFTLL